MKAGALTGKEAIDATGHVVAPGFIDAQSHSANDAFGVKMGILDGRTTQQGSFLGAVALGTHANLFSLRLRRPTSIVPMTGIMVLVPGASAYRRLRTIQTLVSIGAIIAGLVAALAIAPPKATL